MEEKEKIAIAQDWVRKLANGINPLNGNVLKDDDVVNNVHISRCLFYVADLLGKYSERTKKPASLRNLPFLASAMQIDKYNYAEAISISPFAKELEKLIPENMQSVNYKSIVKWLMQEGFLVEGEIDSKGRIPKVPTEKGREIGIYCEERERNGGSYLITLYNRDAQKFLLEHMGEIALMQ